jgi:hypothetical protein
MAGRKYGISARVAALLSAAALGAGLGAAFAGCAAERQVAPPASGLTADTLRAGGLAVVGVTVIDEVEQVRPPLVAALEATLGRSRPDLSLRLAATVRDSLGLAEYRRILLAYQSTGALAPSDLSELGARLGPATRFALLARVEKNDVHVSGAPQPQQPTGVGMSGPMALPPRVTRDARIRFTIYDLSDPYVAWEALYASSSENVLPDSLRNRPRRVAFDAPGAPGAAGDFGGMRPDSPETPPLAAALMEAFRSFAADLPGGASAGATPTAR